MTELNDGKRCWQCFYCGYVYDEAQGDPEHGFLPGTRMEDIPDGWSCPECGAAKSDFYLIGS